MKITFSWAGGDQEAYRLLSSFPGVREMQLEIDPQRDQITFVSDAPHVSAEQYAWLKKHPLSVCITPDRQQKKDNEQDQFERQAEQHEQELSRVLAEGTACACLQEAMFWLSYYIGAQQSDLEPLSTAMELLVRARLLVSRGELYAQ